MTRVEYGIQYLHEDGDWRFSIAGDAEQMSTPDGAVSALNHARALCPDDVWRVVTRTIPDWEPADETALRGAP